jgi:hypothetical protein
MILIQDQQLRTLRSRFAIIALWCTMLAPESLFAKAIADRIILAINSIPYSQTQIERYINVKETLRDGIEKSQTVQQSNWNLAINAFVKDMMIHQDATKSSGFRPTKEAIQRLRFKTEKNISMSPEFKTAFDRLGLARTEIETEILKITTVENYRRGKKSLDEEETSSGSSWEDDLAKRSIVRYFDDAKTWITLEPKS